MTWRELSAERLFELRDPLIIDVRSPCEFKAEYIPGAVNVALLQDDERAMVGTTYAVEGEMVARRQALKIISPKIPDLVDKIIEHKKPGQHIVIHCWRGGLRSETVASFLTVVGIDCWRLTGGFKAWRKTVIDDFARDRYPFTAFVLHGRTGSGKSDVLCALEKLGAQVLNLEQLANHRGSVFGALGLDAQPTQKNFESEIWFKLREFKEGPVFMEAESKKIGKLALPEFLFNRISTGRKILVSASMSSRVQRIVDEYAGKFSSEVKSNAVAAMQNLKVRLGSKRTDEICQLGLNGELSQVTEILLSEYYDPMYDGHIKRNAPYEIAISGDNVTEAASELLRFAKQPIERHAR
ncbi:MAG: tRNA 2-selenouridine(34) synthase MnmH [Cyanobacteria bacterium SZAS-4]|nr:tRNA 2-selenouridine(34) synthase MnmH [Cyanobacteria bacterium SZAS-4]